MFCPDIGVELGLKLHVFDFVQVVGGWLLFEEVLANFKTGMLVVEWMVRSGSACIWLSFDAHG